MILKGSRTLHARSILRRIDSHIALFGSETQGGYIVRGEVESRLKYSTDSKTKKGMCINLTDFSTVRELEVGDGGQGKSDHQIDPSVNGVGGYGRI